MRLQIVILCLLATTAAAADTTTSSARATAAPRIDVRQHGAKGDATTDDTNAFQQALNACEGKAGTVHVPRGEYRIAGHLSVPDCVTLEGTYVSPPTINAGQAARLLAFEGKGDEEGTPFITLHRQSTLRGLEIFYPEQTTSVVSYPWCVRGIGDNITIMDCLLTNPYRAVDFGTHPAGRHYIRGLYSQALKTGIFIDKCFDVGRVENVHFWPFWNGSDEVQEWMKRNATAFIIGRTDWEYMTNCFTIWYGTGYRFIAGPDGPGNAVLTQCGADIGPLAVRVDAVQPHAGVSFVNGQFMSTVEVSESNTGPVKFTACGFWGYGKTDWHALLRGQGHVTFTACHFNPWGEVRPETPGIIAQCGSVTINGCEFLDAGPTKTAIHLMPDVVSAIVTGNRFRTVPRIVNDSEGETVIAMNTGGGKLKIEKALEERDQPALAKLWDRRMASAPLTSHGVALRLSSAVLLKDKAFAALREQLLDSVETDPGAAAETPSFAARARDERLMLSDPAAVKRPAIAVPRARTAPKIDGQLDDGAWAAAKPVVFPGDASATRTHVRLAWDRQALYLAAELHEPGMDNVRCTQDKHDGDIWKDDNMEFFFCPGGVVHQYMQMIVNADGHWYDGTGTMSGTAKTTWDANARVRTRREASRWTIEMALPWSEIGVKAPEAGSMWTCDFRRWRYPADNPERETWSKAPEGGPHHHPQAFGFMTFE